MDMFSPRMIQHATVVLIMIIVPLLGSGRGLSDAHQAPCHRLHSCPSDHNTYVCGDLGHCDQCPDNLYCLGGKPRVAAQQTPPVCATVIAQGRRDLLRHGGGVLHAGRGLHG